jgi:hypothetical protein
MYSALVDDVDTVGCLAVMKLMRAPSTITQLPEKDFLSTMSWAQSVSAMMVTLHLSLEVLLVSLSTKGISAVVLT